MEMIDAGGVYFRDLNECVRNTLNSGKNKISIKNVEGQRYIADGLSHKCRIFIEGTPGNDAAAYMDGPELVVWGNAQDTLGNTMNSGKVIVHGSVGDAAGYGMRGGEIYIKGNVGYRVGIHMKEYNGKKPVIVIGGKTGDFLGEYMAGGIIVVLGLNADSEAIVGNFCGVGMHGGAIYARGSVDPFKVGPEVNIAEAKDEDMEILKEYVGKYSNYFGVDYEAIMEGKFMKLSAHGKRPYKNIYAY